MIDLIKKFGTYFAATVTFLIALKASLGIKADWRLFAFALVALGVVCAAIAWAEVYRRTAGLPPKRSRGADEASVSLAVKQALASVRFAARDDESIAMQANRIVRQDLDKHCIKYKDYKVWRRKNPTIFTAITDIDNQLLGFFDVLPLTDKAACELMDGKVDEHGLTIEAIFPHAENASAKKIYVASIMTNPRQTAYGDIIAKEVLLLKFCEFMTNTFPPDDERILFAYAHTDAGERLLKNAEFRNTGLSKDSKQGDPLYELTSDGYRKLAKLFCAVSGAMVPSTKRNRRRKNISIAS
jgi:hypothetical protein